MKKIHRKNFKLLGITWNNEMTLEDVKDVIESYKEDQKVVRETLQKQAEDNLDLIQNKPKEIDALKKSVAAPAEEEAEAPEMMQQQKKL